MNEELLLKIYNKYGLNQKGSFDKFKTDMQNPQVQWSVYNKYLTQKGTFEQFQSDLGFVQPQQVAKEVPVENTGTLTPQGQKSTIFQYLADSPVVTPQQLPIQLVSTAIASGGKMVEGVIADQVPQQWATVKQAYASSGIKEADQLIELYNQNPQEGERVFSELEKQGLKIRNAGESFVQALQRMQGEKLNTALKLEDEVVQQKSEFANRTAGTVPEFSEIKGAKDFMNWLGTNVGQAGAQMPVSIGTLGSGSFLMEAAEVYDQQLDLIAESTGLSRKEVIEQGLDDPAAGQAYAILAGALDVASIASVTKLFKNMALGGAKKQLAKEVLEKQVKDSFIKSTAKAGATEFLTEGIQGQLETKGATVGAGTEFEWDWKKFFNEGAAGFVGGAGIGTASRATEYFGAKAALAKIDKIEKEFLAELSKMESEIDIESSTGDPELDRSIDALAAQDADMITAELLKEQQVEGAKFEEERRQEQERVRQAEAAKLQAERKQFLAEKLLEFEKSQTLPRNNDPISRAQAIADEEALQNDISAEGLSPKFETKEIDVPKYDPKTLDEIDTQKANQFTYSDGLGGQATGKIVGKTAVLDEIFAAKDAEGNPVKGTNLYGKVLDRLSKQGVKKLRVGMQSAGSRAALGKLIKDKQLTVDPKGGKDIDGNPIDFLIGDIKVKVPSENKQVEEGLNEQNTEFTGETPSLASESKSLEAPVREVGEKKEVFYTGRGEKYEDLNKTKGDFLFFSQNKKNAEWYGGDEANITEAFIDDVDYIDLTSQAKKAKFVEGNFTDEDIQKLYPELKTIALDDRDVRKTYEQKLKELTDRKREQLKENRFSGDNKEQKFLLQKIKDLGYKGVKLLDTFFGESDVSTIVIDKSTVKTVDQQVVKEKVVKEPTVKLPKTVQEPKVKSTTTTTAPKTETVSETKKEDTVKKALVKEQAKQEETITKLRDSVQKALQSYAKRPKMLLNRLESLVQKAESAKLPDLAQEIETTRQKYVEKANKSAEAKELAVNRKAKRLTKEEREAKNIATKEENKKKREAKPENKKVTVKANPKLGIKFNNDKETTLGKAKDLYFTEIAKRIYQEKGQAKIQEAVDAYQQFRKDNNLKDVSDESIKSKAQAYTTTARKDIEKTGRQNTLDREEAKKRGLTLKDYREIKDDIKAAEAKGVSLKQYLDDKQKKTYYQGIPKTTSFMQVILDEEGNPVYEGSLAGAEKFARDNGIQRNIVYVDLDTTNKNSLINKFFKRAGLKEFNESKALTDFKRALEGDLGLDEGSIDDIDFATLGNLTKDKLLDYLETHSLQDYKKSDITLKQYIALAPKSQQPILRGLARVINQYKGNKSTTKIVTLTVPDSDIDKVKISGFHASYSNTDNAYIVILVNEAGTPIGQLKGNNVVLHEYLHDYTTLMFTRAYNLDKKFRLKMERTFNIIKGEIQTKIETIGKKLSSGKPLTTEEQNFYVALKQYTNIKDLNDFVVVDDSVMYAFDDVDEFMSEMFSDPNTVAFLSQVKMDDKIKTGLYKGERKSLLYRWFEDLLDYVKEKLNLTPVENNALDYALDSIVEYDVPFSEGQLERLEASEQFELLSIANKKLNQEAPTKKEVKQNLNIVKNITSTLWKRKEIETQNDVLGYIRKVNARLQENQKLGDGYAEVIFDKINKRRSDLKWYKHVKSALDNYLNQKDKTKDFTSKRLDDLKDFSNVNLDNVPFESLSKFMLAYRNLFYNGTVDKAAYDIMIKYGKVKELIKNTEKVAPKISKAATWVGSISNLTNPSTLSTVIGKYKENVGDLFLSTFFGGLMKSITQSGIESHNFYKNLTTFAEKNRLTHSNLVKIGMYGGIFSTINDPNNTEAWIDEVLENAQHSLSAAKNKLLAVKDKTYRGHLLEREVKKEIDIAEKILSKLQANPSMDGILDKNEKEFYNRVVSFAKLHENDFFLNTEAIWGNEDSQRRYNYFPTLAQGKVGSYDNDSYTTGDELVTTGAESLSEALSGGGKKALRYTDIYSKKVWSNYKRFNPNNYYYEYDALAIGKKWSKKMLYDIYASKEIKALDGLMRDPQTKKLLGDLHPVILRQLKSIVQGTQYTDSGLGPIAMRALKIKDALYTAILATAGQLILQSSSGIIGAAVLAANLNPAKATKNFAKALKYAGKSAVLKNSPLNKWLEDNGMGIQLRDIAFENYLSPDDYRTYTVFSSFRRKAKDATEWALRSGDKFAARAVWFAAYFDAGGTIENPSKEAVLKAERTVGLMQNMSDLSFAAPLFKSNGNLFKRLTLGMFYAYKSFATNAFISMWTAAPKIFASSEARKVFSAQLGSVIAYHAISTLLVRELYEALAKAGDEEDEEEEEKTYSTSQEILTNTLWDMSVGMISPTFLDQGLRWLFNATAAPSLFENETGTFDKYLDSPLYSPNKLEDSYKSLLGPGFREVGEIWEASLNAAALEAANKDDMELLDAQIKRGAATEDMLRMLLNTAIGASTLIPFRGDIKRVLEKARKEKKNKVRKELEMLRSGNSGTILDGEYNSDFNFQDYGTDETLEDFSFEEFLENP